MLVGLNAARVGIPRGESEQFAMLTVKIGQGNGVQGERVDRVWYEYGYYIYELEKAGTLTEEKLVQCIQQASKDRAYYVNNGIRLEPSC